MYVALITAPKGISDCLFVLLSYCTNKGGSLSPQNEIKDKLRENLALFCERQKRIGVRFPALQLER
jgi:hypothetical protein